MDVVFIRALKIETIIGVHAWERKLAQAVLLDLELGTDVPRAAQSDAVADALDYEQVAARAATFVKAGEFHLIETLAERTAEMLMKEFGAAWVKLTVHKPGALKDAAEVGIRIERGAAR
jgi:dihydroneopterin aldolase